MIVDETYLEHFGVKGMRWGHRKPRDEEARKRMFSRSGRDERKRRVLGKSIKDGEESVRIFENEVKNAKTDKERRSAQADLDWAREELSREKFAYSLIEKGKTSPENNDTLMKVGLATAAAGLSIYGGAQLYLSKAKVYGIEDFR